jgi:hypothetical protein
MSRFPRRLRLEATLALIMLVANPLPHAWAAVTREPALPGRLPGSAPAAPGRPATPAPVRPPVAEPATSPTTNDSPPPAPAPSGGPASGSRVDAVTLLPSGGATIHFMVDVPDPEFVTPEASGTAQAMEVRVDGYSLSALRGAARLPERIVVVAVPPVGDVRVRAHAASGTIRDNIAIDQVPAVRGPGRATRPSPAPDVARLVDVGWMRNQRIARIAIRPFSYDGSARRLTSYSHVDVMVDVAPIGDLEITDGTRDAFEGLYHDVVLNYEQGRHWRRPATAGRGARSSSAFQALGRFAVAVSPETSTYVGRLWVKLQVTQAGFYKVSFAQLRNTGIFTQTGDTTTALDSLRLFTWPGVPVLPENTFCDSCDYREVAIQFVDSNNDGEFGSNADYFYFFALGPSDWEDVYDPSRTDSTYLDHPYDTRSFYYLTIGTPEAPVGGVPKRLGTGTATPTANPATQPTTYDARAHFEQDVEYFPDASPQRAGQDLFWEKWFWRSVAIDQPYSTTVTLDGIDLGQPARLRLRAWGINNCTPCGLDTFPPSHILDVTLNSNLGHPQLAEMDWFDDVGVTLDTMLTPAGVTLAAGSNLLSLTVPGIPACTFRQDRSGLAWMDVFYQHLFVASNDQLAFDSPAASDNYRFLITGFQSASPPRLFDVTDPEAPLELTGFDYTNPGGGFQLRFERAQSGRRRYRILPDAAITSMPAASIADAPLASLQNLRSSTNGADFIVVYFDAFQTAAESLATWRQARLPLDNAAPGPYRTFIVPVSAIYDQFSGGRTDPAAIRNFLRAAFQHWQGPAPAFVTLLGDASYDFKNITGHATPGYPSCLLPAYENGYDPGSFLPGDFCSPIGRQFAGDDWLLNVDSTGAVLPDFFGGRIPVDDPTTALNYVRDKLLFYERSAPFGEYRNRVLLVADDAQQGDRDDGLHWTHVQQTRDLDVLSTPFDVDRDYVYLHKYPTAPGFTKPGAKADIRKFVGEGVTLWNYVGHGSPFKISDEGVFLDVDTGTLTNRTMLNAFVSASCDVGKFNDPSVQSLGERLITQTGGGSIGVVSATELALSTQNATLNRTLYDEIFKRDSVVAGGRYYRSLAGALLTAKLRATSTTQKYNLLGDGAVRLNLPREWVEVTLWDSAGTTPDTLMKAGTVKTFRGRVLDHPGGSQLAFNGVANLEIDDSQPLELTPDCPFSPGCGRVLYYYTPGVIFRGAVGITNGQLEGRFVVPLDAASGPRARARAYITGRPSGASVDEDGVGSIRTSVATGTAPPGDNSGPRISLSFNGGATVVKPDATLNVNLFDPSGILTTGHNAQNGIVLTLDGNTTQRVDITSSFHYAANSYQSGTASYRLPGIASGPHTVEVSAADNLASGLNAGAHRSKASLSFVVQETPELHIARAYLFPDPVPSGGPGSGGRFVIDAPGDSLNVLLRLYTVSGRLIKTLRAYAGLGQVQIAWDGLDEEGQRLANGVYLFKVHVYGREEDGSSSPTERAVTTGRFAIVNR